MGQLFVGLELALGNIDMLLFRFFAASLATYGLVAVAAKWSLSRMMREFFLLVVCSVAGHLIDLVLGLHVSGSQVMTDPVRNIGLTLWIARGVILYAVPLISLNDGEVGAAAKVFLARIDLLLASKRAKPCE